MSDQPTQRVIIASEDDAQDCYFAVAAHAQDALRDLSNGFRDPTATAVQVGLLREKYTRLLDLSAVLYVEWQLRKGERTAAAQVPRQTRRAPRSSP